MKHSGKVRTVEQAMNADTITVATIQRVKGREFTEGLMMGWLTYLNDVLNLNKPLSDDQIEMCATEIVNEYYTLKFSDLTLLYKKIISGAYGEFYESLSIPKVLSFFRMYFEERCSLAEDQSKRNHNDYMSDETFNYSSNIKRIWKGSKPSR